MQATLIINEQHSLMEDQFKVISEKGITDYKTILVPAEGWTKSQMNDILASLKGEIIFISPIPYMISRVAGDAALNWGDAALNWEFHQGNYICGDNPHITKCWVMCNDKREKKELPNGRIINVVAKTGWYLA